MKSLLRCISLLSICLMTLGFVLALPVQANSSGISQMFIAPMRVIFGPKDIIQTVAISNRTAYEQNYRLFFSDEVMGENGILATTPEGFPYSVSRMIRFMPQDVTVAPGERQIVRLMLRRPKDMADGDYHSHLVVSPQPLRVSQTETNSAVREGSVGFELNTLTETSIPVFVQQGKLSSKVTFAGVAPQQDDPLGIKLRFTREGNATGSGFVRLVNAMGEDLIRPRLLYLYRERDAYTVSLTRSDAGKNFWGEATLILTAGNQPTAPLLQQERVLIPKLQEPVRETSSSQI